MTSFNQPQDFQSKFPAQWWSKLVAFVALINLVLVIFNVSYIPLRDVYIKHLPIVVKLYDPVKEIEPHPDTTHYIKTVEVLKSELSQSGLKSEQTDYILANLRQQSQSIIEENPYDVANKFGTFAKLKRRMEYHVETPYAQEAFTQFWSQDYLAKVGIVEALAFFDERIRPLLEVNYFRPVDENGQYVDNFWKLDIYFILFLGVDFLGRTLMISRRQPGVSWFDAMLRRWYDWLFLLPTWRWLRVIPVSVRVHKSGLFNLERILAQITHEPAAYLADRVSTFIMVQLINQAKDSVKTGDMARSILEPDPYIQVSEIDKIDAIIDRILQLSIYQVLPKVQPDIEDLLRHSLKGTLTKSDFYQGLQQIPGLKGLPVNVIDQLADYLANASYDVLSSSYSDAEGRELFNKLSDNFKSVLRQELQDEVTQSELQIWLFDLLEELKLNYVQRARKDDPERTLSEAEKLRQEEEERQQELPETGDGRL
ncbi:hypothetical protein ACL6C3_01140 [Capilliphycus salinus ALCB114379]|uniref:hypothetical protein n=1 Tax=Capilliphycus salinus TaxID=2768948 RepID=UPI0039A614BB